MGYFEIGIYNPRHSENIGSLWRTACQLGAAGIFTVCRRYKSQPSDVLHTSEKIPLRHYPTWQEFKAARPVGALVVGIETGGVPLSQFSHPHKAVYLLGSEATGLPEHVLADCNLVCTLESVGACSYNVSIAGSIVLYHRVFLASVSL